MSSEMGLFVKICGLKDQASLEAAIEGGAGAVGFMAYPKSKRYIAAPDLERLLKACPAKGVLKAGVFVNPSREELERYLALGLDVLQLHGAESAALASSLAGRAEIWKAFAPTDREGVDAMDSYPASKLLIDAACGRHYGGQGHLADWELAAYAAKKWPGRLLLAGGLTPHNVAEAIAKVAPAGVDVSSGVESEPGVKSPDLIRDFLKAVRESSL
jgi:phosphoribosylanthranilate isomerase